MKIIGIILTILFLAGIVILVVTQKPNNNEKNLVNVSFSAEYNNQRIVTGLNVDGKLINTTEYYQLIELPTGITTMKNINLVGQNYYEESKQINITKNNTRVDISLSKPQIPSLLIKSSNPLILEVSSNNFKQMSFCLDASLDYVFLKTNYTQIKKPEQYQNYDSCYGTFNLDGKVIIPINYTILSTPNSNDYINITIFDYQNNTISERLL